MHGRIRIPRFTLGLPRPLSRLIPALTISIPVTIFGVAALSFPLTLAQALGVSSTATASWIAALYGISGLVSMALALWYRQPLLVAWSISGTILATTFAGHASYPELCGATLAAGGLVFLLGALGLTERVARWLPTPIVMAMVAGAVLPYVVGMFTSLADAPAMIGGAFAAYVLGRRFLPVRIPAALPAIIVGVVAAGMTGKLNLAQFRWSLPLVQLVTPGFSFATALAYAPVLAVLMTTTSNLAAIVYIKSQGYHPPTRAIDMITGAATIVGSFFGLTPICMASFLAAPTAGAEAGDPDVRHWSVYFSAAGFALIGLLSGIAADLLRIVPLSLLLALAGLALIGVLLSTLQETTRGPLTLGPLLTFAISLSRISYLGFGSLFWALVLGTATSLVLEGAQLRALRRGPLN